MRPLILDWAGASAPQGRPSPVHIVLLYYRIFIDQNALVRETPELMRCERHDPIDRVDRHAEIGQEIAAQ